MNETVKMGQIPISQPGSVRDFVGFLDHVRQARDARGITDPLPTEWFERPAFYFTSPYSLLSSREPVKITPGSAQFDFEFEIAAVVAEDGFDLTPAQAAAHIAGYVLYCDWSARDIQLIEKTLGIGLGKAKDGAVSLGPHVLSASDARSIRTPDGFDITARVTVNGHVLVKSPFRGMQWSFEEMVAYASAGCWVRKGDVIASGTVPGGCLLELSGRDDFSGWLQAGDEVHVDGGPFGDIYTLIEPPPSEVWRGKGSQARHRDWTSVN